MSPQYPEQTTDLPRLSENAQTVLRRRCLAKDGSGTPIETPAQLFWRVADNVAQAETRYPGARRPPEASAHEPLEGAMAKVFRSFGASSSLRTT